MPWNRVVLAVVAVLVIVGGSAAVLRADEPDAQVRARASTSTTGGVASSTTAATTTSTPSTTGPTTTTTAAVTTTSAAGPTSALPPIVEPDATTTPPAATLPAPPPAPTPVPGDGSAVLMVGDSVMLGAAPYLQALAGWSVTVDATVSRQFGRPYTGTGVEAIHAHADDGTLGARVVVHLGTNGRILQDDFDEVMAVLANVPRVVFVTVRIPAYPDIEAENNDLLAANASRYPNMVVADWYSLAVGNPSWFVDDPQGVHPSAEGRQAYANLIGSVL